MNTAKLTIEEKIALLSKTEEAYIRGFIEGAILCGYQTQKRNKPKPKSPKAQRGLRVAEKFNIKREEGTKK